MYKKPDQQDQCKNEKAVLNSQNIQMENLKNTIIKLTKELNKLKKDNQKINTPPYLKEKVTSIINQMITMENGVIKQIKEYNDRIKEEKSIGIKNLQSIEQIQHVDNQGESHDFVHEYGVPLLKEGDQIPKDNYYNEHQQNYGPPSDDYGGYVIKSKYKWYPDDVIEKKNFLKPISKLYTKLIYQNGII